MDTYDDFIADDLDDEAYPNEEEQDPFDSEEYFNQYGCVDGQSDSYPDGYDDPDRTYPREQQVEEDFVGHRQRRRVRDLQPLQPASKSNYLNPTLSSSLPYYGNELERIRNSYRCGSWYSIKTLPSKLGTGTIRLARKERITDNLVSNRVKDAFKPASKRSENFHRSEYIGDASVDGCYCSYWFDVSQSCSFTHSTGTDFEKMRSMNNYWMEDQNRKTYSFSRKPFIITSRVRSLTEDIFFDPDYRVPYTVSR